VPAPAEMTADELDRRSALSWSGGKDSALTLWTLRRKGVEPEALITTVTEVTVQHPLMAGYPRRDCLGKSGFAVLRERCCWP
jgi:hypothetical protein